MTSTVHDVLASEAFHCNCWEELTPTPHDESREEPCLGHYILVGMQTCGSCEQQDKEDGGTEIWFVTEQLEINGFFCHGVWM
jgi:hypothetical protein